jgi:hypothetical protein
MGILIEDGTGRGYQVEVTPQNQIRAVSEIHELQHHLSAVEGQVYQIVGEETSVAATTQTVLHIKNTSTDLDMLVSYMRLQLVGESGGTALPAENTYFQIGFGSTYTSGGSEVTPTNMNQGSGNIAPCTAYDSAPTVGGTFTEIDRWYPDGSRMMVFNKHGSLILGLNNTMEIRLVSDHTDGTAYCRVTAMFKNLNE